MAGDDQLFDELRTRLMSCVREAADELQKVAVTHWAGPVGLDNPYHLEPRDPRLQDHPCGDQMCWRLPCPESWRPPETLQAFLARTQVAGGARLAVYG